MFIYVRHAVDLIEPSELQANLTNPTIATIDPTMVM